MKKLISSFMFLLVLLARPCSAGANSDSLFDVFPFSVQNQWTYDYKSWLWDQLPDVFYADTGVVSYLITDATITQDSTQWTFKEIRDLKHTYYSPGDEFPFADTTYTLRDTSVFQIIESHKGNHPFYRIWQNLNPEPGGSTLSVFPFVLGFADSTILCRYSQIDSSDCDTVTASEKTDGYNSIQYKFVFKKNVGELSLQCSGGSATIRGNTHHMLKSYVLTSTPLIRENTPAQYALFQNFPNPFNGSTRILFRIPYAEFATLELFDVLGRKITTAFKGVVQPGIHSVSLSSDLLASGLYFYRLTSGTYRETKKLVLIK